MAKFRSWEKDKKEFVYFEDGIYSHHTSTNSIVKYYEPLNLDSTQISYFWSNAELVTTKLDNNKNQISLGDFLRTDYPRGIENVIYLVEWSNHYNSIVITNAEFDLEYQLADIEDDCVIIGNQHSRRQGGLKC